MSKIWIGTSAWTYDGWRGPFYPPEVPKKAWLRWYAEQFTTTENTSPDMPNGSIASIRRIKYLRANANRME
jgi:hypothetical protein